MPTLRLTSAEQPLLPPELRDRLVGVHARHLHGESLVGIGMGIHATIVGID
jgi:hypothetical protein